MDSERLLVPGFEHEVMEGLRGRVEMGWGGLQVKMEKQEKQEQEAADAKAGKQKESVYHFCI